MSPHLEYLIQQENLIKVVQVNLVNDSTAISFAMTSPVRPELLTILNKAINHLTDEQKSIISSRNIISIGESRLTLSSIIYGNPVLAISVLIVLLLLILFVVILISRSRIHAAVMRSELEKAEADSRAKGEFLSRMSHEIRTPMNAIVGLTNLTWMMEDLPERARENLTKLKTSSHYLLNLINDILDMSRIESGRLEIASEPFSMRTVLDEVDTMVAAEAETKPIHFRLEAELQEEVLIGDAIRIRQVLLNLLSNAFKFTPPGGTVVAQITEEPLAEERAAFTIRVIDNGIGIATENQQRIFQSFEQLGTNAAKSQGTGLGLSISRTLVQRMGGELELTSSPGKGSEFSFTVTLPRGKPDQASAQGQVREPEQDLNGIRVLVAEDNDLNAEIVTELLEAGGATVERAENGQLAYTMFSNSQPGTYRVILMDVQMPVMNGLEATRAIRSLRRADADLPILAITANTFQEDVRAAKAAGMTAFIPKPIDVVLLFSELEKVLQQPHSE